MKEEVELQKAIATSMKTFATEENIRKARFEYNTKIFNNKSVLLKKQNKKNPLTKEDKRNNQKLASKRALNENVIGMLKRFKIISDRYRNRRKGFSLRFNLIVAIYNMELIK